MLLIYRTFLRPPTVDLHVSSRFQLSLSPFSPFFCRAPSKSRTNQSTMKSWHQALARESPTARSASGHGDRAQHVQHLFQEEGLVAEHLWHPHRTSIGRGTGDGHGAIAWLQLARREGHVEPLPLVETWAASDILGQQANPFDAKIMDRFFGAGPVSGSPFIRPYEEALMRLRTPGSIRREARKTPNGSANERRPSISPRKTTSTIPNIQCTRHPRAGGITCASTFGSLAHQGSIKDWRITYASKKWITCASIMVIGSNGMIGPWGGGGNLME